MREWGGGGRERERLTDLSSNCNPLCVEKFTCHCKYLPKLVLYLGNCQNEWRCISVYD